MVVGRDSSGRKPLHRGKLACQILSEIYTRVRSLRATVLAPARPLFLCMPQGAHGRGAGATSLLTQRRC